MPPSIAQRPLSLRARSSTRIRRKPASKAPRCTVSARLPRCIYHRMVKVCTQDWRFLHNNPRCAKPSTALRCLAPTRLEEMPRSQVFSDIPRGCIPNDPSALRPLRGAEVSHIAGFCAPDSESPCQGASDRRAHNGARPEVHPEEAHRPCPAPPPHPSKQKQVEGLEASDLLSYQKTRLNSSRVPPYLLTARTPSRRRRWWPPPTLRRFRGGRSRRRDCDR